MGFQESDTLDAFMERLWYDHAHDFDLFATAVRERVAQAWRGGADGGWVEPGPADRTQPVSASR